MNAAALRESPRYQWFALGTVMLGSFMGTLDGSIANVSMPTIAHAYQRPIEETEWILLAFMLVTASTLALFGRLGDIFGQKRIYLCGFGLFGLASLACAMSPTLPALIASRVVQAFGAAMMVSSSQALIVNTFPTSMRGRAIGFNGAAVALGLSCGPIVGGAITTYTDWRWIFTINIPISVVALILAAVILKPTKNSGEGLDIAGALLSSVGLFSLSLGISRIHLWGWRSQSFLELMAVAAVALTAFIIVQRRVKYPMLDLTIFDTRVFSFSVAAAFVYFIAFSGIIFIVPLSAQLALHLTPLHAGLLLLPITAMNIVLAPLAGGLSDRIPVRYISTFGALLVAFGTFLLSRVPNHPQTWEIIGALLVAGAGTAVFTQPNNSAIMGAVPPNRRGIAGGTLATARTTGQLLGVATGSAVYLARAAQLGPLGQTFAPATTYFAVVAGVMVLVAAISFARE